MLTNMTGTTFFSGFGTYKQMRAFIDANFGKSFSTDDNAVYDTNSEEGATVAYIFNSSNSGEAIIDYRNGERKVVAHPQTYPA